MKKSLIAILSVFTLACTNATTKDTTTEARNQTTNTENTINPEEQPQTTNTGNTINPEEQPQTTSTEENTHTEETTNINTPTKESKETKEQATIFLDLTLEEAFKKAKTEGKYVFINFHTSTCAPCKKMEKEVFPLPECSEYINKLFIPITIDGEDDGIGTEWAKKHQIFIFPTYLILSPDNFKLGEILGAEYKVDKFLEMIKTIVEQAEK